MITEEIYILTKHSNFDSEYVERIPIYKRRFFLSLLEKENDMINKENEKMMKQYR